MFWGVSVNNKKKYSHTVEDSYHISQAALEPVETLPKNKLVSLYVEIDNKSHLVCTLEHQKNYQSPLDLSFIGGEKVTYHIKGEGTIHLTGYVMPDDEMFEDYSDEEEEEEEEDSKEETNGQANSKKIAEMNKMLKNKGIKRTMDEDDDDDDDDDDDEDDDDDDDDMDDMDEKEMKKLKAKIMGKAGDDDEEEDDDDDEDDDDEDDDDDDDDDEEDDVESEKNKLKELANKFSNQQKGKQQQNQQQNKQNQQQNKQQNQNQQKNQTPKQGGGQTPNAQKGQTPHSQKKNFTPGGNKKQFQKTPGNKPNFNSGKKAKFM